MKKQLKIKRYRTLKSYPGIRQDLISSRFLASICVNGQRHSKNFNSVQEAVEWRSSFVTSSFIDISPGRQRMTFREIWDKYKIEHLTTLEKSSQDNRILMAKFFDGFWNLKIDEITPNLISRHILAKKEIAVKLKNSRRKSFDHEVKLLNAVFNWYKEEIDHTFSNPILRKHKVLGRITKQVLKEKKLNAQELKLFLDTLKERTFWYEFALTHLMTAGRVQEIAGLQKKNVDFRNSKLLIKDVAVWDKKTKKFDYLKDLPKNGLVREVFLSKELKRVLEEKISMDSFQSNFVFHDQGHPLSYRQIQYNYNWALNKAGLGDRFSGTHILRHSMATLTRLVTGSLDSAQAVTGHKDSRLIQHYAHLDKEENERALRAVEDYLQEKDFF